MKQLRLLPVSALTHLGLFSLIGSGKTPSCLSITHIQKFLMAEKLIQWLDQNVLHSSKLALFGSSLLSLFTTCCMYDLKQEIQTKDGRCFLNRWLVVFEGVGTALFQHQTNLAAPNKFQEKVGLVWIILYFAFMQGLGCHLFSFHFLMLTYCSRVIAYF